MKRDRHILQKYLDNELSESELARFEQELSASPDMLVDFELYKEVDTAISDTEVLDFRAQLTDLREERRPSVNSKKVLRFTRPWHYAASAAVALLVAIGLATVLGRPLSNNDLFVKYMKPYELVLTNRSMDNDAIKVNLSIADAAYLNGDFVKAIEFYSEVLEIRSDKMEAQFGIGVSSMGLNEFQQANKSFERVIEQDDNLFIQKAEWFQAGCFLALNDTENARWRLGQIAADPNHFYSKEAEKVLHRMKR